MNSDRIRYAALIITFFTGFTGLVYEVTWHRYLSNFIGSQAQATALILGVFLGGLCVGYWFFGKISRGRSPSSVVLITGWIEVLIGVWAVLFPNIYAAVWNLSGIIDPASSWSFFLELGVCILLIGLPTICMGGTLPLLTQGLSKDLSDAAPFHARVYAINTAGAFAGCLTAGFALLPNLGLPSTMMWVGPLNLIAGVVLLLLGKLLPSEPRSEENQGSNETVGNVSLLPAIFVATLAGLYSITLQTIFIRLIGISMGSSEYAFSMVVAVFVLMLAIGAWFFAGSDESRRFSLWVNQVILVLGAILVYLSVPFWPYASHVLRSLLTSVPPNFYVYHALMFAVLMLVLALPVGAMGGTMPLLFSEVKRRMDKLGDTVGVLYAWNTLGCVLGAIGGGYLLLYAFNLDSIYRLCIAAMATTVLFTCPWKTRCSLLAAPAVLMIAAPILFGPWDHSRLGMGLFRLRNATKLSYEGANDFYKDYFLYANQLTYEDGPNTSVAVVEFSGLPEQQRNHGVDYSRSLYVNGKSDGKTSGNDLGTGRLSGHLPALLSRFDTPNAAVVGFGTGVTLSSLSLYDELDNIYCIEISPVVRDVAPYFDFATRNSSRNPKISWKIGDGYRILGTSKEKFSVIVSVPSNPWVIGVERLYSKEFYNIVKSRLSDGGVYAQWFQIYDASPQVVSLVVKTFSGVFPHVRFFANRYDMIMLGSLEPMDTNKLEALKERVTRPNIQAELQEIGASSVTGVLSLERWIAPEAFQHSDEHTLEYPKLAFTAGREFFLGNAAGLDGFLELPSKRASMKRVAEQSLLNRSQQGRLWETSQLETFARLHCGRVDARLQNKGRSCREALMALALRGELELEGSGILRAVLDGEQADSVDTALQAIGLFERYDSIFIPNLARGMEVYAEPCLSAESPESFQCRLALVEAYALNSHVELARKYFDSNDPRVQPRKKQYLRILLDSASKPKV